MAEVRDVTTILIYNTETKLFNEIYFTTYYRSIKLLPEKSEYQNTHKIAFSCS
jgi:hypothetical protein